MKYNYKHTASGKILAVFVFLFYSFTAIAQNDSIAQSDDDLAKQSHNPLGTLKALPMQLDVDFNIGDAKETGYTYTFQPIFPVKLSEDWTMVSYTILPVTSIPDISGNRNTGLGDLEVSLYLTPAKPKGKFIWGVGPNVVFPTATDSHLGTSKWSVGPALAIGIQSGSWTAFGLFDNVWSVGGWGDTPVNTLNFQYYVTYQSPGSWFLVSNYVISSDWLAPVGEGWIVPLGAGAGSMVKFNKLSGAAYIQSSYNVLAPTGASNWGIIFAFELIFQ
jgi:hypothetical protein